MKYLFLLVTVISITAKAQLQKPALTKGTTTLPAGTVLQNGVITVQSGYRAVPSAKDDKVIVIQKVSTNKMMSNSSFTGSFTCACEADGKTDDCAVSVRGGNMVICSGVLCNNCVMNVTINPQVGINITRDTKNQVWKKYNYPTKNAN